MSARVRLFLILWLAGFAGVLSFQLVDLQALIAMLPYTQGKPLPLSMAVIRLLSIMQGAVLVAVAVFVGVLLASRVRLSAPAAHALANRQPFLPAIRPQLLPGVFGAAIAAPAILGSWFLWKPFLSPSFVRSAENLNRMLPPLTRLLYGGITEELLLRWGFMSFGLGGMEGIAERKRGSASRICARRHRLFRFSFRRRSPSHRHCVEWRAQPSSHHVCCPGQRHLRLHRRFSLLEEGTGIGHSGSRFDSCRLSSLRLDLSSSRPRMGAGIV